MPPQVRHVSLVPHEALVALVTPEGEVASVSAGVSHQLVAVPERLLAVLARVAFVVTLVDP